MLGSPLYMSPEQIKSSKQVDVRADVWSAAVILYELLTKTLPFQADTAGGLFASILTDPPTSVRSVRPELPEPIERAIAGCLEKDVARRVPSVGRLAELIAPFGTADARLSLVRIAGILGETPLAQPLDAPGSLVRPKRRSWKLGIALGIIVLVVAAAVSLLRVNAPERTPAPVTSEAMPTIGLPPAQSGPRVEPEPLEAKVPVPAPPSSVAPEPSKAPPSVRPAAPVRVAGRKKPAPAPAPAAPSAKSEGRPKVILEDLIQQR